jgi:aminotransferase
VQSIVENDSHYTSNRGKIELRKAISGYLERTRGVHYDPETEIVATVGATEALAATIFSLINEGDKVIIPTPAFSLYFPLVSLAGGTPVQVDVSEDDFVLTPELLENVLKKEGPAVKAVLLNYPVNPTGREYPRDVLEGLAKVIADHHLYVFADEIYSDLVYGVEHTSMATLLPDRTIFISGLSKSHAMTGYRMGYFAGPKEAIDNITKLHSFLVTSITDSTQAAAIEAYTNGDEDPVKARAIYQKRRDYVLKSLNDMGIETVPPQGAFYIFAKIPASYGTDDMQFALDLAKEAQVGVTPGNAFGAGGAGWVRLSYAASDEDLHTAMERMKPFIEKVNAKN